MSSSNNIVSFKNQIMDRFQYQEQKLKWTLTNTLFINYNVITIKESREGFYCTWMVRSRPYNILEIVVTVANEKRLRITPSPSIPPPPPHTHRSIIAQWPLATFSVDAIIIDCFEGSWFIGQLKLKTLK